MCLGLPLSKSKKVRREGRCEPFRQRDDIDCCSRCGRTVIRSGWFKIAAVDLSIASAGIEVVACCAKCVARHLSARQICGNLRQRSRDLTLEIELIVSSSFDGRNVNYCEGSIPRSASHDSHSPTIASRLIRISLAS